MDRVYLFQDGSWNALSNRAKGRPEDIRKCVSLFQRMIPWGQVRQAPSNLGIALNYERAERFLFEEFDAESALFLEDDLVLSPNYLATISQLLDMARRDPSIAYVSAYGNLWASRAEQREKSRELIPMHENWGAALTRRAWLAERPFRQEYLALLEGRDYSERDHDAIKAFYDKRGWTNSITSQDAARWIACLERGEVRVSSYACHAYYIGRRGQHSNPGHYRAARLGETVMFKGPVPQLQDMSETQRLEWLAAEAARFKGVGKPFYPGHAHLAPAE